LSREAQVRAPKKPERARETHPLSSQGTEEGKNQDNEKKNRLRKGHLHTVECRGASQDTGRNRVIEGHSPTVECRGRKKSGNQKREGRRVLTNCRVQRVDISQDTERNQQPRGLTNC